MDEIYYIDRNTSKKCHEKVYGLKALKFVYGKDWISSLFGYGLLHLLIKNPLFSKIYGFWQKQFFTKKKIQPFIDAFEIDTSEFLLSPENYSSFNDFFVRKLKKEARPIAPGTDTAIIPADGRYLFYPNIHQSEGFIVKGEKFHLADLLEDEELASRYSEGTMVIARLCPTDYHRFHFPCDCIPGETRVINGWLYSVNPIALRRDIQIFTKNKRTLCELETSHFGKVLYLEIGATNVGSINQTYIPGKFYPKGTEKGFFSFGASSLILLFEPDRLKLDADLFSTEGLEIRCLLGQSMGRGKGEG